MDLLSLTPVERIVPILHPVTKVELGITVSLMSLQDERMKKIKRRILDEKLRLQSRGKDFKAEEIQENGNLIIFSAMTGWEWSGDATFNNEKPAFNQANVFKVFEKLPWFRAQLDEALNDEEAFFPTSEVDSKKQLASTAVTK